MSKEEIQHIYDYAKSKKDLIIKFNLQNIKNFNKKNLQLKLILSKIGITKIDIASLKQHWLEIKKRDYELNPKYCLWCGKKLPFEKRFLKCCNQSCANSFSNKKRGPHSKETNEKIGNSLRKSKIHKINNRKAIIKRKQKISNNKVKYTKEYKIIKNNICKYCGKEFNQFTIRNVGGRNYCSKECKHNYLSEHTGGYRLGSGYSKSGWYKGIRCDSTWELAFLIYHLDNNLFIERCKEKRTYIWKDKEHIYYPDFVTDKGIIEIKGYKTDQSEEKRIQNPDIINIYKEDIQFYLDYVKEKYGKSLIELYDSSKPNKDFLNNEKYIWMHNDNLQKNTMIYPIKYEEFIKLGWVHGRKKYN